MFYTGFAGKQGVIRYGIPVSFARYSTFITYPPDVGPGITEKKHLRLHAANQFKCVGPVVIRSPIYFTGFIGTAVVPTSTISAIKPHFKHRAIVREQFLKLIA